MAPNNYSDSDTSDSDLESSDSEKEKIIAKKQEQQELKNLVTKNIIKSLQEASSKEKVLDENEKNLKTTIELGEEKTSLLQTQLVDQSTAIKSKITELEQAIKELNILNEGLTNTSQRNELLKKFNLESLSPNDRKKHITQRIENNKEEITKSTDDLETISDDIETKIKVREIEVAELKNLQEGYPDLKKLSMHYQKDSKEKLTSSELDTTKIKVFGFIKKIDPNSNLNMNSPNKDIIASLSSSSQLLKEKIQQIQYNFENDIYDKNIISIPITQPNTQANEENPSLNINLRKSSVDNLELYSNKEIEEKKNIQDKIEEIITLKDKVEKFIQLQTYLEKDPDDKQKLLQSAVAQRNFAMNGGSMHPDINSILQSINKDGDHKQALKKLQELHETLNPNLKDPQAQGKQDTKDFQKRINALEAQFNPKVKKEGENLNQEDKQVPGNLGSQDIPKDIIKQAVTICKEQQRAREEKEAELNKKLKELEEIFKREKSTIPKKSTIHENSMMGYAKSMVKSVGKRVGVYKGSGKEEALKTLQEEEKVQTAREQEALKTVLEGIKKIIEFKYKEGIDKINESLANDKLPKFLSKEIDQNRYLKLMEILSDVSKASMKLGPDQFGKPKTESRGKQ